MRLLREWDAGIDVLLGGDSTAQLELQQLLSFQEDSESQVGPCKTWLPCHRDHAENVLAPGCHNRTRQRPAVRELPQPLPALHLHSRECGAIVTGRARQAIGDLAFTFASASSEIQVLPAAFQLWGWKVGALFGPKISFLLPLVEMNFKMSHIALAKYDALHQV